MGLLQGLIRVRLGLGATMPKDGDVKRQDLSSNDKLRKQLLGKDFAKLYERSGSGGKSGLGVLPMGSKPRPTAAKRAVENDEEDEGGRSSLGKSKRRRKADKQGSDEAWDGTGTTKSVESNLEELVSRPKKPSNYLDEVLADRERKKETKKRKGNKKGVNGSPSQP